jgi:S-adenosylhomocysteine hydrolase
MTMAAPTTASDVRDLSMPVLRQVRQRFERERPLAGIRISACLHATTETANQALTAEYLRQHSSSLKPGVYTVPREINREIVRLKLLSMGVQVDILTPEQERYLASWESGT